MADVTLNGVGYSLVTDDDGNPNGGMRGAETKQDLTPSALQTAEQIPGDTDIAVSGIIAYGDANGAFGLSDRTLAPGDMARPFITELDNTRPRQMTAWVGPSAPTNVGGTSVRSTIPIVALVDAAGGFGFVTQDSGSSNRFWQWDGAKYNNAGASTAGPATMAYSGYTSRASYGTHAAPAAVVQDYAGGLWMATNGGIVSVPSLTTHGDANAACTAVYLDILFSFGLTADGITIKPYRFTNGQTPDTALNGAANAQVQKVDAQPGSTTYGTVIASTAVIQGEHAINGVIANEGTLFLVTDRSVYAIIWNDLYNTVGFDRLPINLPALTSAPVAWNGEVWIGAGNQIVHIAPHQGNYDIVLVDDIGRMPAPWGGRVQCLMATPQYLAAMLVDDLTATPSNTVLALRDANGVWVTREFIQNNILTPIFPLLQKMDANGFALATLSALNQTTQWTLLSAGKNPRNLTTAQRAQEGTQRIIFPWEYGTNESAVKQLLRARLQVYTVGAINAATHVRSYFQFENDDSATDAVRVGTVSVAPVWTGIAKGTGAWNAAGDAYTTAVGDYQSAINATSGSGYLWNEYDGATAYGSVTVSAGAVTGITPPGGNPVGRDYTTTPSVQIVPAPGQPGSGATATATVVSGQVIGYTVTAGGSGYVSGGVVAVCNGGKVGGGGGSYSLGVNFWNNTVAAYPTWKRIRWMIEVGGDTTGTLVPTAAALIWYYNEYPSITYQFTVRLRFRIGDTHLAPGTYANSAAIVAALDGVEALKNGKTIVPYTGVDGHSWYVLVTKVSRDLLQKNANGVSEAEASVTLQVIPFQGAN